MSIKLSDYINECMIPTFQIIVWYKAKFKTELNKTVKIQVIVIQKNCKDAAQIIDVWKTQLPPLSIFFHQMK